MSTLRRWSITLVTAAITAAVLIGAAIPFVVKHHTHHAQTARAAQPALANPGTPSNTPRPIGPEGVPLVRTAPLGPASAPAPGASRGGVPCGSTEQVAYHVHAHLLLYVDGKPRAIPAGVGIAPPLTITQNPGGPFVSGGRCFSFLHTHAADGIIHIESPARAGFRLGQFFDVWRQRLDPGHLGRFTGRVLCYVNGRRYRGDPRAIPLRKHAQIQLEIGRPLVPPILITFPRGL